MIQGGTPCGILQQIRKCAADRYTHTHSRYDDVRQQQIKSADSRRWWTRNFRNVLISSSSIRTKWRRLGWRLLPADQGWIFGLQSEISLLDFFLPIIRNLRHLFSIIFLLNINVCKYVIFSGVLTFLAIQSGCCQVYLPHSSLYCSCKQLCKQTNPSIHPST